MYPDGYLERSVDLREAETARAKHYLDTLAAAQRTASSAPPVSTRVAYGDAADEICAVAREVGADAIAMATHGRGGLARLLLGSVATRTIHQATVPVLVYRPVAVRQTMLEHAVEQVAAQR